MERFTLPLHSHVCFVVPPKGIKTVIRDYAGGLGFEADSGYILPPLDLLQLAACTKVSNNFVVSLIDAEAEGIGIEEVIARLRRAEPKLVISEFSIPTLKDDLQYVEELVKAGFKVVGKLYSKDQAILRYVLEDGLVSYCIIGECEDNISEVLQGLDDRGIAMLDEQGIKIFEKELIEDLDSLPFPDRALSIGNRYWYPKLGDCATILSSRGCPYPCRYYCPYPLTQGKDFRAKSAAYVLAELEEVKKLGVSKISFRDPVFSLKKQRVVDICTGLIERQLAFEWWCETRADLLPDELLELMAQAGCVGINVGVESGDPKLRYSLLKRGVSDEALFRVVSTGKRLGIKVAFLLMVGFPGETRLSVLNTAELLCKCRPFSVGIGFPVHHPGTQLEKDAREKGWILVDDYTTTDGSLPVLAGPGLGAQEMQEGRQLLLDLFECISQDSFRESEVLEIIRQWSQR